MKLPDLTQQPIKYIDATPNEEYPLRILQAYRQDCDCMWSDNTSGEPSQNPIFEAMNEDNRKRSRILDKAIKALIESQGEALEQ